MKSVIDLSNQVKGYTAAGKTIAPVENGETAVGSYAIGEQFVREGVLYKAKTAITAGDTLTLNTNYELDDPVMEQLNSQKQALSDEVETRALLGAHNFCPNEIEAGTYQSVVITNNADESSSVTGSIATTDTNVTLVVANDILLKAGKYVLSGIPDNIQAGYGYVQAYVTTTAGADLSWVDRGSDKSLAVKTLANDTHVKITLVIYHANAQTFDFTYKPMIALASDPSTEFTPHAMTNRELTEKVDGVEYEMQYNGAYFHVIKYGDYYHCYSNSNFTSEPSIDNWTTIGSVPNSTNRDFCGILIMNSGVIIKVRVKADGDVQIYKVSGTFGSNLYIQCSCVLA